MNILTYFLVAVEAITSLLLIIVILLQKTKSQGAGLAFGAGVGEQLFGAQVGNVLTRTTVVLTIIFLVNTTLLVKLGLKGGGDSSVTDTVTTSQDAGTAGIPGGTATTP